MSGAEATLTTLPGVGPRVAARLAALGIAQPDDLLLHRPLRYEDRTRLTPIAQVRPGTAVQIEGRIRHQEVQRRRRRMLVALLADASGEIVLRFFHFYPSQAAALRPDTRVRCFGEVRPGFDGLEMAHPQFQVIRTAQGAPLAEHLTAIYPTTAGLSQGTLSELIGHHLDALMHGRVHLPDPLDDGPLWPLLDALTYLHRPPPDADLDALLDGHHPAVRRLAVEELMAHHAAMARLNRERERQRAPALKAQGRLGSSLLAALPFKPTRAQQRVMREIGKDLQSTRPMRRLLQGDVGAGKTVVAAHAALAAAECGRQTAIVAPTEILAEQHYRTLSDWLQPLGLQPCWLAGKVKGRARQAALEALAGGAPVAIGTHALFQAGVGFRDLALVIIDEQHRFGVHQRLALAAKGGDGAARVPHQLVMTATPIPRTLAMTTYAGLDISVLDELPPGRTPVATVAVSHGRRGEVISRIARALQAGRQAYWVCTLIDDSEQLEAEAAASTAETLRTALPGTRVGLIHGRMKPAEKEAVMAEFAGGRLQLLVATTVIEVGVDVPNASLMIIDNAERLGLSQLHQLRGRVGRGTTESACVLLYRPPLSTMARARLQTLRETGDGFVIAERDLELRGPGEVLGTRQTGLMRFRVADLTRDADCLDQVKRLAAGLEKNNPSGMTAIIDRWIGADGQFGDV